MPSSLGSALLLFGIIFALCAVPVAAVIAGAAGVLWEVFLLFVVT